MGLENARLWFIMEAAQKEGRGNAMLPSEVPLGFVHDWLAYHDLQALAA